MKNYNSEKTLLSEGSEISAEIVDIWCKNGVSCVSSSGDDCVKIRIKTKDGILFDCFNVTNMFQEEE